MNRTDLAGGFISTFIGLVIAFEAWQIPDPGFDNSGPGAFPLALGLVIAACGVAMLLEALAKRREAEKNDPARWGVLLAAFVLLIAYAESLTYVGFLVATVVFVPASLALLGARGPFRLAFSGIAVSLGVYAFFAVLLKVDLPSGMIYQALFQG